MARTKQDRFTLRFKAQPCRRCGTEIPKGGVGHRLKSHVYCLACGESPDRDKACPVRRPDRKRNPRNAKKIVPPDPTKGGGPMPGEKCAIRCADRVWRYGFASIGEAVRDALDDYAQNEDTREFLRGKLDGALSGRSNWANYFTRARFMRELAKPSRDLLAAVDAMRERLIGQVAAPSSPRRRIRRGQEFGDELDADRYLTRSPAPWDRNVRELQACRTVTIGCNLSINGSRKPEELLYRGAAALALADVLSDRGVNVGIVLFESRTNGTSQVKRAVGRHVVKDPMMPLDLSSVAFAMCEIAYFRTIMAIGGIRHFPGTKNTGLGSSAELPVGDREGLDYLIDADVLSEQAAAEWLTGCLAGQETEVCRV